MINKPAIAGHAAQLRANLELGSGEVIGDIIQLTQRAEYDYLEESFGEQFKLYSGFSQYLSPNRYLIGFNSDHFWTKAFHRFTVAHELGHLSIPAHRETIDGIKLQRSKGEYLSPDPLEREADYFAVSFLAPEQAFRTAMRPYDYTKEAVHRLADHFGVSPYSAVLRFVELTDLACSLIVSNADGTVDYERPSDSMRQSYRHRPLKGEAIPVTTLTSDYIRGNKWEDTCTIRLNDWFDDLKVEVDVIESVIELGYNGKFLTLLTPHVADLDTYSMEAEEAD